jgi:hypothetical protein
MQQSLMGERGSRGDCAGIAPMLPIAATGEFRYIDGVSEERPRPKLNVVEDLRQSAPGPIPPTVQLLEGDVLYREWVPGPAGRHWWVAVVVPVAIAVVAAGFAAREGVLGATLLGILALIASAVAATGFAFRGLAIVVDSRGLRWNFGPLWRRYSLDEISMFRERVFHFPKAGGYGGWGIGKAVDGVDIYEVWGANGAALDLVVRRKEVTRHYLVSTAAPERLVVQLVRAMERRK